MEEFVATAVGHSLEELTNIPKNQILFAEQLHMVICQPTMTIQKARLRLLDNVATILQQSANANFTDLNGVWKLVNVIHHFHDRCNIFLGLQLILFT